MKADLMFRSPEPDQIGGQDQGQTETDIKSLETSCASGNLSRLAPFVSHLSRGGTETAALIGIRSDKNTIDRLLLARHEAC